MDEQKWLEDQEAVMADDTDAEETDLILKFEKPYVFEGETHTELDLSGLEDTTAGTMAAVGKIVNKRTPGLNPATVEMSMEYAKCMAQRITKKPMEFFEKMPSREAVKLKSIVVGFLFGGDGED